MSVVVNGMKMPESCRECPFENYHSDIGQTVCMASLRVLATGFKTISFDGRHPACPLVALPYKHGRLIDENDVINAIHERIQELQTHKEFIKKRGDIDLLGVLPYIAKIQAIIEAEGKG